MPHEGSLSISVKMFDRIYNLLLCSWEETEKHKTTIYPTRSLLFFSSDMRTEVYENMILLLQP